MDGMQELQPDQPFPDELFYRIFEIDSIVERTQFIQRARNEAQRLKRVREFNELFKAFVEDYRQKMRETGNTTRFTLQPMELECGQWRATDLGVSIQHFDSKGMPVTTMACSHPIMPIQILKNVDTGNERVTLAYFKYGEWQKVTVDRDVCADNSTIVKVLSKIGIEVTSENAKALVRYISDCIGLNSAKLEPKKSINRLGWTGGEFMPYADGIVYDGGDEFNVIYRNIGEHGDFDVWKGHCSILRKNKAVRMAFAASFASSFLEIVHALPFAFHLWSGESGTCKTVAVMAAMSIWGNPKMGRLVKTMNTTKFNITQTAAFLHSLPYAGDELQTMKDKWTTNFDQLIYQITEGVERGRGKRSGGVEETKTWHNSFLFTGEEPITKANSRAGSKNRVIEIEVEEKLMENGNYTVGLLTEHYGHAGRRLIRYLQDTGRKALQEEYTGTFNALCSLDTTEKQAMAMACILMADRILTEVIFTDETAFSVDDVKIYLKSAKEVDVAERAYEAVLNWIARNPLRFEDPGDSESANRGEVWGKIVVDGRDPGKPPTAVINKDVLCEFLEKSGFDYAAVSKKWAAGDRLVKNSQGKFVHQTKVYGIKASYVKVNMRPEADQNGFVQLEDIEDGQLELPFD